MTKGQQIIKECRERMSKYTDAQRLEIKGWADRLATASVSKTDGPLNGLASSTLAPSAFNKCSRSPTVEAVRLDRIQ